MLYTGSVDAVAAISLKKATAMKHSLIGFLILSGLAGCYVGFGVILAFINAAPIASLIGPVAKTVAGATFGIALSLVIIAGSELFTGYNLLIFKGSFRGTITFGDAMLGWLWTYIGNVAGSFIFALMVLACGIFAKDPWLGFLLKVANFKSTAPWWTLFFRGILCNWLVCLAIWSSLRCTSDSGKLIMIWWCLFCFITTGMEHSIANVTILALANMLPHPNHPGITWGSMFGWNLVAVTLGNIVGGGFFVTFLYWFATYMDELGARKMGGAQGGSGADELPRGVGAYEEIKDIQVKIKA